ncbi:hypothetical protein [Agrococcus sp. HG114]|uniref:hypothetical protein n=1 Tax=Agrococcus sp. HG114 TaxID=2969757 RepID=UPI00215B4E45|nr:hypothetical protein [Agrococcus sp. HG114]MCR8669906.1 hypothetical protein [Agrococcus sp. HG114]
MSPELLQALWDSTSDPGLRHAIARNITAPLALIGASRHSDFGEIELAIYALRMGQPHLACLIREPAPDPDTTLDERWREIGGLPRSAPGAEPPRVPSAATTAVDGRSRA